MDKTTTTMIALALLLSAATAVLFAVYSKSDNEQGKQASNITSGLSLGVFVLAFVVLSVRYFIKK